MGGIPISTPSRGTREEIGWQLRLEAQISLADPTEARFPQCLSERPHAHATGLDDGKITRPVGTGHDQFCEALPVVTRLWHWRTHKHDSTLWRQSRFTGQFAEFFVERQQNALFPDCPCQHVRIARSRLGSPDPNYVVPGCLEHCHSRAWEILVGEKTHFRPRLGIPSPSSVCHAHRRGRR